MTINEQINNLAQKYSFFAKDKKLYESGSGISFDSSQWGKFIAELTALIQPKTTSTDIEKLKKEFTKRFGLNAYLGGQMMPSGKTENVSISAIFDFFAPHLSNKSELEKEGSR